MAFTESIPVDLLTPDVKFSRSWLPRAYTRTKEINGLNDLLFQKLATPIIYENQRDKWIK